MRSVARVAICHRRIFHVNQRGSMRNARSCTRSAYGVLSVPTNRSSERTRYRGIERNEFEHRCQAPALIGPGDMEMGYGRVRLDRCGERGASYTRCDERICVLRRITEERFNHHARDTRNPAHRGAHERTCIDQDVAL
jgi:hypothetical protein